MNLTLFNVKYSANLGDGVIAECLEGEITRRTGWEVRSIDLAGRQEWCAPGSSRMRTLALKLLQIMPGRLRDFVLSMLLDRHVLGNLVPKWRDALAQTDAVVIGGGQLFQDLDLNFPIKIAAAYDTASERNLPVGIFAVGATRTRSQNGQALFAALLSSDRLFYASARDEASRRALSERGCVASVCRDPGLLAARQWPDVELTPGDRTVVGVCVTHPVVLTHHSGHALGLDQTSSVERYVRIAESLIAAGYSVTCFSNGAGEDEKFLARVANRLKRTPRIYDHVTVAKRRATPEALARLIGSFDGVVAHRLHAVITAYSYMRPVIGLRWDKKLDAFFHSIGEANCLIDFDEHCAEIVAQRMNAALQRGLRAEDHARVLGETEHGIARLIEALKPIKHATRRRAA